MKGIGNLKLDALIDAENNKPKVMLSEWQQFLYENGDVIVPLHVQSDDQPPTPEHYKLNPQRRRMWKIDLQREERMFVAWKTRSN